MDTCHTHRFSTHSYVLAVLIIFRFSTHFYVWIQVILVYFRFSTHSYVLGGYLSYSCTLDLYTFLSARWIPVILVYFRFSTHSYVHIPVILVYFKFSTNSYVLGGYLSYSCTLDLVHIHMCTLVSCHTRVL